MMDVLSFSFVNIYLQLTKKYDGVNEMLQNNICSFTNKMPIHIHTKFSYIAEKNSLSHFNIEEAYVWGFRSMKTRACVCLSMYNIVIFEKRKKKRIWVEN